MGLILGVILMAVSNSVQASPGAKIVVNLPSRTLDYYEQDQWIRQFPIAIGKVSTPTPLGNYCVEDKEVNPTWYPPDQPYSVPSGPENPLGYRWLGFSGNYGIHGTNQPDSIGSSVSNGCIRMQENDVESLFAAVDDATPIQVIYERIHILIDPLGVATLGIYPDVYGRQAISLYDVQQKLAEKHLDGFLSAEDINHLWQQAQGQQVSFALVHRLIVNQRELPDYGITLDDQVLVPVKAMLDYVPGIVSYDSQTSTVSSDAATFPAAVIGSDWYVAYDKLPLLFGGKSVFDKVDNCINILFPAVYFNGNLFSQKITASQGESVLPLAEIGRMLGRTVTYDKTLQIVKVGWYRVPFTLIEGEPYIKISQLPEALNIGSAFDEDKQVYNLTYPYAAIDYSMDIGAMADFKAE
jgi:hypothetical protein